LLRRGHADISGLDLITSMHAGCSILLNGGCPYRESLHKRSNVAVRYHAHSNQHAYNKVAPALSCIGRNLSIKIRARVREPEENREGQIQQYELLFMSKLTICLTIFYRESVSSSSSVKFSNSNNNYLERLKCESN